MNSVRICQAEDACLTALQTLEHVNESRIRSEDLLQRKRCVTLLVIIQWVNSMMLYKTADSKSILFVIAHVQRCRFFVVQSQRTEIIVNPLDHKIHHPGTLAHTPSTHRVSACEYKVLSMSSHNMHSASLASTASCRSDSKPTYSCHGLSSDMVPHGRKPPLRCIILWRRVQTCTVPPRRSFPPLPFHSVCRARTPS